jgi:hypothetical protein
MRPATESAVTIGTRVIRWKPGGLRVVLQAIEPQRSRIVDQHAENAAPAGQVADLLDLLGRDSDRHERDELAAVAVEHAEGAVLRIRQRHRVLDDPLEHAVQRSLAAERLAGFHERVLLSLVARQVVALGEPLQPDRRLQRETLADGDSLRGRRRVDVQLDEPATGARVGIAQLDKEPAVRIDRELVGTQLVTGAGANAHVVGVDQAVQEHAQRRAAGVDMLHARELDAGGGGPARCEGRRHAVPVPAFTAVLTGADLAG